MENNFPLEPFRCRETGPVFVVFILTSSVQSIEIIQGSLALR